MTSGHRFNLPRRWRLELILNTEMFLVGVNWSKATPTALYVHLGPLIVGVYRFAEITVTRGVRVLRQARRR